jgi:hypothetical protein
MHQHQNIDLASLCYNTNVTMFNKKPTSFAVLGFEGDVLVPHAHAAQAAVRSLAVCNTYVALFKLQPTSFAVLCFEGEVLIHHAHAAQAAVCSLDVPAEQQAISLCQQAAIRSLDVPAARHEKAFSTSQMAADLLSDLI